MNGKLENYYFLHGRGILTKPFCAIYYFFRTLILSLVITLEAKGCGNLHL